MTILTESMTKLSVEHWNVRIWREETGDDPVDHDALKKEAASLYAPTDTGVQFARKVLALDRINAVEVIHSFIGNGAVLYRDWP